MGLEASGKTNAAASRAHNGFIASPFQATSFRSVHVEQNLADMLARFHQLMGKSCICERETGMNGWLQIMGCEQRPHACTQYLRKPSLLLNGLWTQGRGH